LGKGALPVEETLILCRQIAEALETAHEKENALWRKTRAITDLAWVF
jgi:hypothetical protein